MSSQAQRVVKFSSDAVADYYDENTRRFLALGQGGNESAIHRAVWGPGVEDEAAAFHYVDGLLLEELAETPVAVTRPRVLDLGCGVGATLIYLLRRSAAEGFGITVSELQAALAREHAPDDVAGRLHVWQGDFCTETLPDDVNLAYGIESFAHASDSQAFFERAAASLAPGGRLALCDDFLTHAGTRASEQQWVSEFRRGWRLSSLLTSGDADALAAKQGLSPAKDRDLTPFLQIDRPRDRALRGLVALARPFRPRSARWGNFLGGNALRQCLKRGLVAYRYRVWTKGG